MKLPLETLAPELRVAVERLSEPMRAALEHAVKHGELVRQEGGFWTEEFPARSAAYPGQPEAFQRYAWHAGTATIRGLLVKKLLFVSRKIEGSSERNPWPIGVTPHPDVARAACQWFRSSRDLG